MKKLIITIISLAFVFASCKDDKKSSDTKDLKSDEVVVAKEEVKTGHAICLYDKLSIRDKPSKDGKWMTSMSLGEKVTFTGEEVLDSVSKRKYCKVTLTDGKEGWTRSDLMAINGEVGAMKEAATVYKRPDLLTKTENKFSPMDIVAIMATQDDWVQVKGKRAEGKYIEESWIKSSNISNASVDIATAKFATMAMNKPSMTERIKALEELVNNSDLATSSFIPSLKTKILEYQERNEEIQPEDAEKAPAEAAEKGPEDAKEATDF